MSTIEAGTYADLATWFSERPKWMQHAAARLLSDESITPEVLKEITKMAIDEALDELPAPKMPLELAILGVVDGTSARLKNISEVQGIGRLNPRRPLQFGESPITVVYGNNGSGKSSYVRILKHVCGARNKGSLHANAFDSAEIEQCCKVTYQTGDEDKTLEWSVESGIASELSTIDIFDTHCGDSYLSKEGEPSYEPRILAFLTDLAGLCDRVGTRLDAELQKRSNSGLPSLPKEWAETDSGKWYAALSSSTIQSQVDRRTTWTNENAQEVDDLVKYFTERSPKERAAALTKQREHTLALKEEIIQLANAYSPESFEKICKLRSDAQATQKAAELAAKVGLKEAVLEGVGSETWLALWNVARNYSTEAAYPNHKFPHTGEESRCVLCQQELQEEGKRRLGSFEAFVKAEASGAAHEAKKKFDGALKTLPEIKKELLLSKAEQAGLLDDDQAELTIALEVLSSHRNPFLKSSDDEAVLAEDEKVVTLTEKLDGIASKLATKSKEFLDSFKPEERAQKERRKSELDAMKWISSQKTSIEAEIKRKKQIEILENARRLCNTSALSRKKGSLSEELLTPAYIESFNRELRNLGARRIKVELTKTRVDRGHILHQVKLKDAARSQPIHDILSEGEHRIVCIAAFLADVGAKPNASSFVFDDPISSLDLDYEEAVVQRLVDLSKERQIIIFTHRLSLLGMVEDYAEKAGFTPDVVHIRSETWGSGEPGDASIESAKPKASINQHLPERIREARTILDTDGEAAYRIHAQQICSEMRKLVERMIETDLLADVLQRHRRQIKTLNKIEKLADITDDDCRFIDEMMTRYSRYEHSQSAEAPVALPDPNELDEDVAKMKAWRDCIEKRRK